MFPSSFDQDLQQDFDNFQPEQKNKNHYEGWGNPQTPHVSLFDSAQNQHSAFFTSFTSFYKKEFSQINHNIQYMKNHVTDENEREEIDNIQKQMNELSQTAFNTQNTLQSSKHRSRIDTEMQNLKRRLQRLQQENRNLKQRIDKIETKMVTKQDFQELQKECKEKFDLFNEQIQVIKDENDKMYMYIDEKFKESLSPPQKFVEKLKQYSETNYRVYEYARRMYWGLMNQILAYRSLSTGLVQKGYIKSKFREIGDLFSEAVNFLGEVPVIGGFLNTVKDIASMFFHKQDEIIIHNMSKRVEGYFVEECIAEDVIDAVILLAENPKIQKRLFQFRSSEPSGLEKFLKLIDFAISLPDKLMGKFVKKVVGIEKQHNDNDMVSENVVADCSLLIWKLVSEAPLDLQHPITEGVTKYLESIQEEEEGNENGSQWENRIPQSQDRQKCFRCQILKAELTLKKELWGKMNPYCVVKYRSQRHQTEVHEDGHMQPYWGTQFLFESTPMTSAIVFQIYDKQTIGSDDYLGEATLVDSQYSEQIQRIELIESGRSSGKLFVRLTSMK